MLNIQKLNLMHEAFHQKYVLPSNQSFNIVSFENSPVIP
jgi:hypothetical protein